MNLFDLVAKVSLDTSEYERKSKDVVSNGKALAGKVGSAMATTAKVVAAGVAAAAGAVSGLVAMSIKEYANYEQLVGGVDTLFKSSSDKLQKYAAEAYKTAGVSANEYMEQATSFSASLIQSLGGDTEAAVEYANKAIVDMSDNANKMGSDIKSIQIAYQGFSKQNFTMLDNLKLGFGGTKEEMERLLDKADEINAQNGIHTEYQIENYADIVDAIHVVQEEMGISGTTAAEAADTIEGSLNATKASFKNLMVGIADENANFEGLVDQFVESVATAADNLLPRFEIALGGVAQLIEKLFPVIMDRIPAIIHDTLPKIVSAAVGILKALVKGINDNSKLIVDTTIDLVFTFTHTIAELLPDIFEAGLTMLISLAEALISDPVRIMESVVEIITVMIEAIMDGLPRLIKAGGDMVVALIEGNDNEHPALEDSGRRIVDALVRGILNSLNGIADAAVRIVDTFAQMIEDGVMKVVDWFNNIWENVFGHRVIDVDVNGHIQYEQSWADNGYNSAWENDSYDNGGYDNSYDSGGYDSGGGFDVNDSGVGDRTVTGGATLHPDGTVTLNGRVWATLRDYLEEIGFYGGGGGFDVNSHANGLEYVPYNGYISELHKGEIVLSRQEADKYRMGMNDNMPTIGTVNINIDGAKYEDERSLAEAISEELEAMMDRRRAAFA